MNIKNFLKQHPALHYAEDIQAICSPLGFLDIVYFSHIQIDKQGYLAGIGNVPDFFHLYFEKGYYNFDLHMAKPNQVEEYTVWDAVQRKKQSFELHQDFMLFNQGHTFSIVVHHAAGKDCYHFATRLGNEKMNGQYLQLLDSLKKFISFFKEKVTLDKELSKAYQLKIPLALNKGGYLVDTTINTVSFNEAITSNRSFSPIGNQYLTQRELECLSWFAKGKTIEETARILGITPRTVKAYMQQMKEKLDCVSQFQLGMHYGKHIQNLPTSS